MKTLFIFIVLLFFTCFAGWAENGLIYHPYPPVYSVYQLRYKNDIQIDAQQNIWVAFRDIGLGKYNGSTWTFYDSSSTGFPGNEVRCIAFDSANTVWAGTSKGLAKFNGTSWMVYDSLNSGLPGNKIYSVKCIGNLVLCGTDFGLAVFNGSNWSLFDKNNSGIAGDLVRSIETGLYGEWWIGTAGTGICKLKNNSWNVFNSSNSTVDSAASITKIVVDYTNEAWFYAANVLYKISKQTVYDFYKELYVGAITPVPNQFSILKNNSGRILLPGLLDYNYFSYNEITGNEIEMHVSISKIQFVSGGYLNSKGACDKNNRLWLATLADSNGINCLLSYDKSQDKPGPLVTTNENSKVLDINGVKTTLLNRGDMHWDLKTARYEAPKGSGLNSVFASALWMGGIDNGGQLHVAAQTYRQSGSDFWPGPIDTITGLSDTVTVTPYDKIWKINRTAIQDFKINYKNGSVTNGTYPVPVEILTWPAHGTGNLSKDFAPFVDFNADGIYNPLKGDYPLIKGDQMCYWIINDNLSTHTESSGLPLGVEIHCSAYAYTCDHLQDSDAVMHYSTFYNYRIINRSANDYSKFIIGLWCDMDLGNATDDYIGCDSVLNAGFTYNGDNDDEASYGYGLNPPMQNIKILKGPLADTNDGLDNNHDGEIDEPEEKCMLSGFMTYGGFFDPNGFSDFYSLLNSKWTDGIPLTYGDNGRNPPDSVHWPTKFFFSGTPYDTSTKGWTEAFVGNTPGDRHFLMTSGPVTLLAGSEKTIDFAYVFSRDSLAPNGLNTSVAKNKKDLQKVQDWFDQTNFPSCLVLNPDTAEFPVLNTTLIIRPNPSKDVIYIEGIDLISFPSFEIFDVAGRLIMSDILKQNFINIFNLSKGMYFLRVKIRDTVNCIKFVKA